MKGHCWNYRLAGRRRKEGCADAVGNQDDEGAPLEGEEWGGCRDQDDASGLLKLGLLEGDKEGWTKSLGDEDGKLEYPV